MLETCCFCIALGKKDDFGCKDKATIHVKYFNSFKINIYEIHLILLYLKKISKASIINIQ